MKTILLGTTTLIGAASLFAGAAFADTPKVTVGGYENFELGITSDDENSSLSNYEKSLSGADRTSERPQAFRSDTQVDFKIDGKSDAGLGYGGEVDLLADTSADVQGRGLNASKTFIYMDGMWGRTELGSNVGADGTMKVDAGTIARATGGINGDWNYFANASTQFLAQAALPLGYGRTGVESNVTLFSPTSFDNAGNFTGQHTEENLDKVTYYTPRFAGFQVGVSYLPDQLNRGQGFASTGAPDAFGPNRTKDIAGEAQNIFTGGLNYDNKFGDVGFTLAGTGEWGESQSSLYENLAAWEAGGKLSYMGWSVAGSYGSWGSSNTLKTDHSNDTHYWDVGAAYEYGPFGVSLTYLNSQFDCGNGTGTAGTSDFGASSDCTAGAGSDTELAGTNKFTNVSLGADYKLAPGLTPYVEVSWFDENAVGTVNDNKGYVGILGTQLNF